MHGLVLSHKVFSSLGNAPLFCNIFFLATFHSLFSAMNPPVSNSFHNILYSSLSHPSFLSIDLPIPCLLGWDPAVFKDLKSFQHVAVLFCAHLLRLAAVHQFWSHFLLCVTRAFSAPKSKLLPACPFFLPSPCQPICCFLHFPKIVVKYVGPVHVPRIFMFLLPLPHLPFDALFPFFSCPQESTFLLGLRLESFIPPPDSENSLHAACKAAYTSSRSC